MTNVHERVGPWTDVHARLAPQGSIHERLGLQGGQVKILLQKYTKKDTLWPAPSELVHDHKP
ncbi:unnamed protein product [Prunus armeniaca]